MGLVTAEAMRAERAEAAYWATYARNIPTTDDTRDTGAISVAGGYAICLQDSSINYGLGVGTSRSLREDDLRIVDEFYGSRDLPSRLELHPLVAERDARLLASWGYRPELSMTVLECEIDAAFDRPPTDGFILETLTARRSEWIDLIVAGVAESTSATELARVRRTTAACASAASALLAIRIDGRLAGGGAVGITGDVAFLFCASTLPAFRGQGIHAALTSARLAVGRSRGATSAFMTALPTSLAISSAQSVGFVPTYVRRRLRKR